MMTAVLGWLKTASWLGMPAWVWLLIFTLGAVNQAIRAAKWTEAMSIWEGIWRFVLWIPAIGPFLERFPIIGLVLRKCAGKTEEGLPLPPAPPPAAVLLPITFLLAGCQCWQPAHQNDVGCIVARQAIDCTKGAIAGVLPAVLAIFGAMPGGQVSGDAIVEQLKGQGINAAAKDVICIAAALAADFGGRASGSEPERMRAAQSKAALVAIETHYQVPLNTKIRVVVHGRETWL